MQSLSLVGEGSQRGSYRTARSSLPFTSRVLEVVTGVLARIRRSTHARTHARTLRKRAKTLSREAHVYV